jgi:DoxX-like family
MKLIAHDLLLIRLTLASVWLGTALVVLCFYPQADSLQLLARVGLQGTVAVVLLHLSTAFDLLLGILTLLWPHKTLWLIQALLILGYSVIISIFLPEYWQHPFGPMLKNLPILLLLWLLYRHPPATTSNLD